MARSPRQAPPARAPRVAKPSETRAAGHPTPPSVAATPASFYDPDTAEALLGQPVTGRPPLGGAEALQQTASAFHAQTALGAVEVDHDLSADERIAGEVAHEDGEREETLEEAIARVRSLNRPLGLFTQKLALPKRSGYHTHWFNDEGSRLVDALGAGWTHRKDDDGKPYRRAVGRGRDSGVLYAYALNIPDVIWQEEMSARHQQAGAKMDSLKRTPAMAPSGTAHKSDQGKFYSPVEGVDPIQIARPGATV